MTAVVALGGGHGLAATLRAARLYADDLTAVVSVADDGGSSGRLRRAFGIPAPGDLRKCLVALADDESLWARAFEHRFQAGELDGHALGNLVLAGLLATTGDFTAALAEAGRLLGSQGRVLPATSEPVVLKAEVRDPAAGGHGSSAGAGRPREVEGQVAVAQTGAIATVSVVPADAAPPPAVLDAIAGADQVVLGPGSLYTSVLAVVAVPAIRAALVAATGATKVYVCNLREQVPETQGYDVAAHVRALADHGVDVDVVLCHPGALPAGAVGVRCVERPVARPDRLAHDPEQLAAALADLVG